MKENTSTTILAEDIEFRGKIRFTDKLEINGLVEGEIFTEFGDIIIHKEAKVKAEIHANNITHHGQFEGIFRSKECIAIHKGAKVLGEIHAQELAFERGAHFQGTCHIKAHESAPKQIANDFTSISPENSESP